MSVLIDVVTQIEHPASAEPADNDFVELAHDSSSCDLFCRDYATDGVTFLARHAAASLAFCNGVLP